MDKTEHIRDDCRVLMSGGGGSTKAGSVRHAMVSFLYSSFSFVCRLEIMASTSSNLATRNFSNTVQMSFVTLAENFN